MKRLWLVVALIALVVPAAAQAKGGGEGKKAVGKAAKQHCKALRAEMGAEEFRAAFAGKDGKRAMKRCVKAQRKLRKRARSACRAEGKRGSALRRCVTERMDKESTASPEAFKNAAVECKAMQAEDPEGFADEFGDGSNAFGKCVSQLADEESEEREAEHSDSEDDPDTDDPAGDEPGEHEPAGPDEL